MTRREEIRKGLRYFVQGDCAYFGEKECPFENNLACQECDERIHELLTYLHSRDVVIKIVDGELPEWLKFNWAKNPCCTSQDAVDEQFTFDIIEDAGYTKTAPLIGE